jgi:molybdopterin converting factor small subunit
MPVLARKRGTNPGSDWGPAFPRAGTMRLLAHLQLVKAMETIPIQVEIRVSVSFYSYFRDLTGCAETVEIVNDGETLGGLFEKLVSRFARLGPMRNSTLMAVGVDYQDRSYVLKPGDEVSLFPPVQGG